MILPSTTSRLATILALSFVPAVAQEQAVEFDAKITGFKITRYFDGTTIVTGVDPRFLVRLVLHEDVRGVGKAGDAISFAIHSPAMELQITDLEEATGKQIRLSLVQPSESLKLLRRAKTMNAQQGIAPQSANRPESDS